MRIEEAQRQLVTEVIHRAIKDAVYLLAVERGKKRASPLRLKESKDALEWVMGAGMENASDILGLGPWFVKDTRAEIVTPGYELGNV